MASEINTNSQLVVYHNPPRLEAIHKNDGVKPIADKLSKDPISAIVTPIMEAMPLLFRDFNFFLKTIALNHGNNIHLYKNPEGNYIYCSPSLNRTITHIKGDEFQFVEHEIVYSITIPGHPSFHITPNHIWEKIVSSDKSKYISGSKKTQKTAINEKGVKAARLVCNLEKYKEFFLAEFNILNQFKNQRGIVQIYDLVEARNKTGDWRLTLYEELFEYGDMVSLIENDLITLTGKDVSDAIEDLLHGFHAIHEKGYVHRDFKPDNVLFKRVNGKMVAAICDFDLAIPITNNPIRLSGSIPILSPEKLSAVLRKADKPWTGNDEIRADVWAAGITLYSLRMRGEPPWGGYKGNDQIEKLSQWFDKYSKKQADPNGGKSFFKKPILKEKPIDYLIWLMCQLDPKLRPDMREVLELWKKIPAEFKG